MSELDKLEEELLTLFNEAYESAINYGYNKARLEIKMRQGIEELKHAYPERFNDN